MRDNLLESLATFCGILNIYFCVRNHMLTWVFGILMVSIYAVIFFHVKLYADMLLQMVSFILQCYGLMRWLKRDPATHQTIVYEASAKQLFFALFLCIATITCLVVFLSLCTDSQTVYIDATTSGASLVALWMQARRWIQHWLLWTIVDIISLPMYMMKSLYFTVGLYLFFTALNIVGYYQWRKQMRNPILLSPA